MEIARNFPTRKARTAHKRSQEKEERDREGEKEMLGEIARGVGRFRGQRDLRASERASDCVARNRRTYEGARARRLGQDSTLYREVSPAARLA